MRGGSAEEHERQGGAGEGEGEGGRGRGIVQVVDMLLPLPLLDRYSRGPEIHAATRGSGGGGTSDPPPVSFPVPSSLPGP
jgi:hypothetical protein